MRESKIVAYEVAEAIRQGKARYCRFVDTRQWDAFEGVATPNATFTFRGLNGEVLYHFASTREMVAASAPLLDGARSSHSVSNSELSWRDDGSVQAIWAMQDRIVFPSRDGQPPSVLAGAGHYHEVWRPVGDTWRLSALDLRRTILDHGPL